MSIEDHVADVRLNRPDKRNALDPEMFQAIADVGEQLQHEKDVRVVVLSGEGKSFCAGLDMTSMTAIGDKEKDRGDQPDIGAVGAGKITHLGQQVAWVWQELSVPVIAAVHGHALGGGIQIALGADIRFVHPDTKMSVRETYWGLVPDMTGTFQLGKLVRPDIAKELTFTARIFTGAEGFELGLVTHLSDTPYDDAMELARQICQVSPTAVQASKHLINHMAVDGAESQFAHERRLIAEQIGTPNQTESVMAHFEKRPAIFND